MLKKHKNAIFELLRASEYGIENFGLTESIADGRTLTTIKFKQTDLRFLVKDDVNKHDRFEVRYALFQKGFPLSMVWNGGIDTVREKLNMWMNRHLKEYQSEIEGPDLWEDYMKGNNSFNPDDINFKDQTDFTSTEKEQIRLAINDLKMLIQKELKTTPEEQIVVNERLDYLAKSVDRLNKFDWKGVAIQTLFSIAVSLSFDTQKGKQLYELFHKVFLVIPQIPQLLGVQ
jgi:hypothetical protein